MGYAYLRSIEPRHPNPGDAERQNVAGDCGHRSPLSSDCRSVAEVDHNHKDEHENCQYHRSVQHKGTAPCFLNHEGRDPCSDAGKCVHYRSQERSQEWGEPDLTEDDSAVVDNKVDAWKWSARVISEVLYNSTYPSIAVDREPGTQSLVDARLEALFICGQSAQLHEDHRGSDDSYQYRPKSGWTA